MHVGYDKRKKRDEREKKGKERMMGIARKDVEKKQEDRAVAKGQRDGMEGEEECVGRGKGRRDGGRVKR